MKTICGHTFDENNLNSTSLVIDLGANRGFFSKDIIEKYNNKWIEPENIVTLGNYILSKWENHDFILLKPRDSS